MFALPECQRRRRPARHRQSLTTRSLVSEGGFEPPPPCGDMALNHARLPNSATPTCGNAHDWRQPGTLRDQIVAKLSAHPLPFDLRELPVRLELRQGLVDLRHQAPVVVA